MKTIKQRLEENYLLGCIKYDDHSAFYLMPIAWWILNYEAYSPSILQDSSRQNFRNGALNVTDDKIKVFLGSVEEDKIALSDVKQIMMDSSEYSQIYFFIDFDEKLYINGFADIETERYLPDNSWTGKYASPLDYISKETLDFGSNLE